MACQGWDERDYRLWSELQQLPSYGLNGKGSDCLISRQEVVELMASLAEKRFSQKGKVNP